MDVAFFERKEAFFISNMAEANNILKEREKMQKESEITTDLIDQREQLMPAASRENSLHEVSRAMNLDDIFFKDPWAAAADLLQKQMITGHNSKVALLALVNILSAKLKKPMGLMLAASDFSVGMKILKQCMLLAPEDAYKECGQLKIEEIFNNYEELDCRAIISLEPLAFTKPWTHLERLLTLGYSTHTEIVKSKYDTFPRSYRADSLISLVGIIPDMKDQTYDSPSILKVPLRVDEYPLSQLLGQDGRQADLSIEVATVRLRETLARLRPMTVDIPFADVLFNAIKACNPSNPERKMEIILKTLTICCIIDNPEQVCKDEIIARIYKIDVHKLRQLQASSVVNQNIPEKLPILVATKIDYYHTWLLLNDMIPVKEISLSDRQIKVFEAVKQINIGKLGTSFIPNSIIKQLSQMASSSAYWAKRENIFEALNTTGNEELSQSTIYNELQHLMKEGLVAEGKYPKSSLKGYHITTFEAGKKISLPHPSEIIDDTFKGEKVQVTNPLTGLLQTI